MKTTRVFCDHCGKEIGKAFKDVEVKIKVRDCNEFTRNILYDKGFELCNNCTLQLNDYINKYMEGCNVV